MILRQTHSQFASICPMTPVLRVLLVLVILLGAAAVLSAEEKDNRAAETHSRLKNILSKATKKIDKEPKSMNRQIVDFKKEAQKKQKDSYKVGRRKTFAAQRENYNAKKKLNGKIEFD